VADTDDNAIQSLIDRQAIVDVLTRYTTALDLKDWDLLAEQFTPDAVVDYSAEGGPVCHGRAEMVADCQADLGKLDATHHLTGNFVIEVQGDAATSRSLVQAWHYSAAGGERGGTQLMAGGYEDRLVRTSDGWKLEHRRLLVAFESGDQSIKGR
jgi:ketosteroid isomerase-like protein